MFASSWSGWRAPSTPFARRVRCLLERSVYAAIVSYQESVTGVAEGGTEASLIFSRPQKLLAGLGYPFARGLQRRFARDSVAAMQRAVADAQSNNRSQV